MKCLSDWTRASCEAIEDFISKESSAGILLMFVTVAALLLKNSPLSAAYNAFLHIPVEVRFGALHLAKPLLLWINDGLMAVFFLLIGLEVKREIVEGNLSSWSQAALPVVAALGGMLVPAAVYIAFNWNNAEAMQGWAIPTATDIAFALGILSLLGSRVPVAMKVFLLALAIIDDLGAIVIIAIFYTVDLSPLSLVIASAALTVLILMNRTGVAKKAAYILVGMVLWVSVLKSGVHATLAGVALAFTIPLTSQDAEGKTFSLSKTIEHDLHFWVAFLVLPLFAFVNAGVDLRDISLKEMTGSVPMGIALGLLLGKQIGVFGFSWVSIRFGFASLPEGSTWRHMYGVSVLTGIGFTMSLFIDSLAFQDEQVYQYADKLAVLAGSFLSAIAGYLILRKA